MTSIRYRAYNEKTKDWDNSYFNLQTDAPNLRQGIIFQLCSGLKDATDKPIYEGDIIFVSGFDRLEHYEVIFKDGAFWCGKDNVELLHEVNQRSLVVGNIFNSRIGSKKSLLWKTKK